MDHNNVVGTGGLHSNRCLSVRELNLSFAYLVPYKPELLSLKQHMDSCLEPCVDRIKALIGPSRVWTSFTFLLLRLRRRKIV